MQNIILYGRVCRICMCKSSNMHKLNEIDDKNGLSLKEMLYQTIEGKVQHHQDVEFPLPQEICERCVDNLGIAYKFQEMCLSSNEQMYKIWKESEKERNNEVVAVEGAMKLCLQHSDDLDPIKLEHDMEAVTKDENYLAGEHGKLAAEVGIKENSGKINNKKTPKMTNVYDVLKECQKSNDEYEDDDNVPLSTLRINESPLSEYCGDVADEDERNDTNYKHFQTADLNNLETSSNHCSFCNKYFKYAHHLAKHQCSLAAKQAYKCEMCPKEFSSVSMLQKHKRNKHKDVRPSRKGNKRKANKSEGMQENHHVQTLECRQGIEVDPAAHPNETEMNDTREDEGSLTELDKDDENCDAVYVTADQLSSKVTKTPPPATDDFSCSECNASFISDKQLKRHIKKHTEAHRFVCLVCSDRFKFPSLLHKHVERHHPEENSKPNKCASTVAENKKENLEKSHICKYCPSAYTNVGGLAQHISKKHPEIVPFKCDQCEKTFVVEEHLKIHTNRHMGIKNFKCELCDKSFSFKFAMKQHMRIHTGDLNYLCTLCGKKFYRPSNLRQHMQRHGDEKPYTCPHCPKRFKCPSDRYIHLMSHQEGKNHVCSTCGARFSRVDTLHQHQVLHTGEKPYKCDQCPMAFYRLMNLNRHLRTHTGEKPYKCKYCDKAYAQSNDLNKHLRTHVGENTYMCTQCPTAFKYQADLRNHQWEHYRRQKEEEQSRTTKTEAIMSEMELKTSTIIDGVQ